MLKSPNCIRSGPHLSLWAMFLVLLITGLAGCTRRDDGITRLQGKTMGTTYRVIYASTGASDKEEQQAVDELLQEINLSLSIYIDTSLISQINASADTSRWYSTDQHFEIVFDRARSIYEDTQGAFNPAVGPLVNAWGFGPEKGETLPDSTQLDSLRTLVDFDGFVRRLSPPAVQKRIPGAQLDFNAIAKGYGVDAIGLLLEARGVTNYFVEIGGEVRTRGKHPAARSWRAGIERPTEDSEAGQVAQAVLSLDDAALATSGNYRNYYVKDGRKYVHTINPATGYPEISSLLSVSVLAKDCMTADAYATAFMVMGLERAMAFVKSRDGLEAYFIMSDAAGNYIEKKSPGFPATPPQ